MAKCVNLSEVEFERHSLAFEEIHDKAPDAFELTSATLVNLIAPSVKDFSGGEIVSYGNKTLKPLTKSLQNEISWFEID